MSNDDNGKKFWAARYGRQVGPFESRETALAAYGKKFPEAISSKYPIATGYGNFGPHFDIRWDKL